ncbi:hypothetical protein VSR01_28360 [Actinacidiphila sp. DG2A-62]|uniref:hypothetical protein n=1 Tax=Actinacidiphila sp. DG2A-62 TaxID=3108821 RepID=UPI002DB95E30|nr:hypothetical protein [Actinacidiphila sp. DG2A-62]MEC3997204.1 hypothetical protein [Actinacidiphila sp. DG2A-62]
MTTTEAAPGPRTGDLTASVLTDNTGDTHDSAISAEAGLVAALGRLRTAARTAGLHLSLGYPVATTDGNRIPLGDAGEATVRTLARLLSGTATASTTDPQPNAELGMEPGVAPAGRWLHAAARAAGVELAAGAPRTAADGTPALPLGSLDRDGTVRLAEAIEAHLTGLHATVWRLTAALSGIGVAARPRLESGQVALGEITVPDGVLLLHRLHPDSPIPEQADPDDLTAGEQLADQLADALRPAATGLVDVAYAPYCRRCHTEPALILGRLARPGPTP